MKRLSASSLKLYLGCPRRWVFERIEGFRAEATQQKTLGTEVHSEIEAWIKHGTLPRHVVALKWLAMFKGHPYFPSKETSASEEEFVMSMGDVTWTGYTDWRRQKVLGSREHIVGDAKTTNDLKYALSAGPGGLLVDADGAIDPQSTLYATREFVEGAMTVDLHWAYVQSKAPYATRLVETSVDPLACEDAYGKFHERALEMNQLYSIRPKANDVPYRKGYCNAFNKPCEQSERCIRSRGVFQSDALNLDSYEPPKDLENMKNFLDAIKNSVPAFDEDEAPPPPVDEDDAPPPPPEDDMPPAPPEDEELEAERLVEEYMASQRTPKAAPRTVESGFVNPPEAAGKVPYATPEEAAVGEGVTSPSTNNLVAVLEASLLSATEAECGGADGAAEEVARLEDELEKVKPKARKTRAKKTDKTPQHEVAVVDTKGFTVVEGHDFDTGTGDRIEDTACEPQPLTSDELEAIVEATAELTTDTIQDDIRRIIREELKAFFTGLGK